MITVTPPPLRAVIVGKGRLGRALGSALGRAGRAPVVVAGRDSPDRQAEVLAEAERAGAGVLLLLAVRDESLPELVSVLSGSSSDLPDGTVVLHHSGAHGAGLLAPLARRGIATGSCHPLQTFTGSTADANRFRGITFAVDGSGAGLTAAELLVRTLGGHPVFVAEKDRPLYHLAASLGGNGVTGLVGAARDAFVAAGFAPVDALGALGPLLRSALDEALRLGPEASLTGPLARGDGVTLERHRRALLAWDASRIALLEALLREQRLLARRDRGRAEC